jgi:hypothetical protein
VASDPSDELPIPLWFIVWGGFVAAALLVPAQLIRQFFIDPATESMLQYGTSPEALEGFRETSVLMMRAFAVGFAVLYLVLRVLTFRLRGNGNTDA